MKQEQRVRKNLDTHGVRMQELIARGLSVEAASMQAFSELFRRPKVAVMKDIKRELRMGGAVELDWLKCQRTLIAADGTRMRIDGRTYHGFLKTFKDAPNPPFKIVETEVGSAEKEDLVITWRKD